MWSIRRASNIGRISGHVPRGYVVINNNTCYNNIYHVTITLEDLDLDQSALPSQDCALAAFGALESFSGPNPKTPF